MMHGSAGLPAQACDTHFHIFGPESEYPFAADRSYTPPDAGIDDYRALQRRLGFSRGVVVQPSVYGTDNRRTLTAVAELGIEHTRAVVAIPAGQPRRAIAALDAAGARGVRFTGLATGGADLGDLDRIARQVAEFGWHVELWMPAGVWADREAELRSLPVDVVIDHTGQLSPSRGWTDPAAQALLRLLDSGHCYVKVIGYRISEQGPPFEDVEPLVTRLIADYPERCLWGTDWPHPMIDDTPDDHLLLEQFQRWAASSTARDRILVENPARLYRFG